MPKQKLLATQNDLSPSVREKSVMLLNQQLADTFDLLSQTKQAHWNVKGPNFIALHEFFDSLAESVTEYVDLIAERATALGGTAMGTARMAAKASRLPEYPADISDSRQHVEALSAAYADLARTSRAAIDTAAAFGDADTADVFTEVSRGLDKHLWMLESHLFNK